MTRMRAGEAAGMALVVACIFVGGRNLATSSPGDSAAVWKGHSAGVTDAAFVPGEDSVVSCGLDGTVRLWDTRSGRMKKIVSSEKDELFALSVDRGGRAIAVTGYSGQVRIVIPKDGSSRVLSGYRGWSADVALSPDSRRVAVWSMDGDIWIFSSETGDHVKTLKGQPNKWGMALAWSPDGTRLAAGRAAISIWDVESGKVVQTLAGHTDFTRELAFSPDGKRLASAGMDKSVRVWDLAEGKEKYVLKPEGLAFYADSGLVTAPIGLPMTAVAFSPDGKTLASGGADRVVRLWDAESGSIRREFKGHRNAISAVAFSPDGSRLISSALDHTIRCWTLE
jgi:WD40 repeat protein